MRRGAVGLLLAASVLVTATATTVVNLATDDDPAPAAAQSTCSTSLTRTNNSGANALSIPCLPATPCWRQGSNTYRTSDLPFSACVAPTTTTTTTTTIAPTTTTSTTEAPTTSSTTSTTIASTTTTVPSGGVQFVETFDGNGGLNRFRYGVYHRNLGYYEVGNPSAVWGSHAGGSWTGDHDLNCGSPVTQRPFSDSSNNPEVADLLYTCVDHLMSAMGDVDNYSIAWFAPNQVFASVDQVSFDVNLTNLGARKWWKVGVVSDALFNSTHPAGLCVPNGSTCNSNWQDTRVPGFILSDVPAGNTWSTSLAASDRLFASWSGGSSAGFPGFLKIGNTSTNVQSNPAPNDKATRFPVSLVDNHNGTVTFTVAGVAVTRAGSFPACPCRVVFLDQNYTPDKDGAIQGHAWHWDSVVVR